MAEKLFERDDFQNTTVSRSVPFQSNARRALVEISIRPQDRRQSRNSARFTIEALFANGAFVPVTVVDWQGGPNADDPEVAKDFDPRYPPSRIRLVSDCSNAMTFSAEITFS